MTKLLFALGLNFLLHNFVNFLIMVNFVNKHLFLFLLFP